MYSKVSHGSEGDSYIHRLQIWLMYSKVSHGSEGLIDVDICMV